ncbi:hypothetical protein [Paenibacillus assamensis]|uniref:hypothetical protein n=1 Tax=Paenibacillus assamensis TaxID=311244 RepID=UPI00040037DF|nr:hypothetical protein [Paenibacillus assamensis]
MITKMSSKNRRFFFIFLSFLFMAIIIIFCINISQSKQDTLLNMKSFTTKESGVLSLNKSDYIVSYSSILEKGAQLLTYDSKGNIHQQQDLKAGQKIDNAVKWNEVIYYLSERSNRNYSFQSSGEIYSFFGLPEIYGTDRGLGYTFIRADADYMFLSLNIGSHPDFSPDQYSNALIYWNKESEKQNHIQLRGYLFSLFVKNNKAYVMYDDSDQEKLGIYVIDLATNKLVQDFPISSQNRNKVASDRYFYTSTLYHGQCCVLFHDQIAVTLDDGNGNPQIAPVIRFLDISNGTVKYEIELPSGFFPLITEVYLDKLYVFDLSGKVIVINRNKEIEREYELEQSEAFKQKLADNEGVVGHIMKHKDEVLVLYDFIKEKPLDRNREIHRYDLLTGKLNAVTPLTFKSEREIVHFFPLD